MTALGVAGFWSYVHLDDDAEDGRICELAGLIQAEYALLTGQELQLFVDRDIEWGEQWRARIEEALTGVTFFIPIITPRYFTRDECRRELLKFANEASSLGVRELLLPILYVDVPGLEEDSSDQAVAVVASTQYVDWTSLRLRDTTSPEHREAVHKLATRLADITEAVAARPVEIPESPEEQLAEVRDTLVRAGGAEPAADDDAPGIMEVLADAEAALPRMGETMEAMSEVMNEINAITVEGTAQIERSDERGKGFAGRVVVAHNLARKLEDPSDRMLALASNYAQALLSVDEGMGVLIELLEQSSPDDHESACQLFASIKAMAQVGREMVASHKTLHDSIGENAKFSRELRPPLRTQQDALRRLIDGQAVIDEWEARIDASPLDCTNVAAAS